MQKNELGHPTAYLIQKFTRNGAKTKMLRAKTINVLEKNIGISFCDFGLSSGFLDWTPNAQATKGKKKKDKLNFIEIKRTFVLQRIP